MASQSEAETIVFPGNRGLVQKARFGFARSFRLGDQLRRQSRAPARRVT